MQDLINIGCMLKDHYVSNSHENTVAVTETSAPQEKTWIMRAGTRGTEMWIIERGQVQIERNVTGTATTTAVGRLGPMDVFGEMAVLVQESPGVPLQRMRSASVLSRSVSLQRLTYEDVQKLRERSVAIDRAVRKAIEAVQRNRPSLFKKNGSETKRSPTQSVSPANTELGLDEKVDELGAKVDALMADMALIKAKLLS